MWARPRDVLFYIEVLTHTASTVMSAFEVVLIPDRPEKLWRLCAHVGLLNIRMDLSHLRNAGGETYFFGGITEVGDFVSTAGRTRLAGWPRFHR